VHCVGQMEGRAADDQSAARAIYVTDFQRDQVPVTDNVDSADVEPFLTKTDAACQTCGNTKGAPASRSAKDGSVGIPDVA
jgi:hypothetical protein